MPDGLGVIYSPCLLEAGIGIILSISPTEIFPCEASGLMFVPLVLDLVRVKDRPEIFLVFHLDRDNQTADLLYPGSDIAAHGIHWAMLEDADENQAS